MLAFSLGGGAEPHSAHHSLTLLPYHVQVNFRTLPDGSQSPYELNIVYFSALSNPKTEPADLCVQRFLASQSILVAFPGVPGIYIHRCASSDLVLVVRG